MYLDGYTPEEILMAHRKMMYENLKEPEVAEIVIRSEVKVKWEDREMKMRKTKRKSDSPLLKKNFSQLWRKV